MKKSIFIVMCLCAIMINNERLAVQIGSIFNNQLYVSYLSLIITCVAFLITLINLLNKNVNTKILGVLLFICSIGGFFIGFTTFYANYSLYSAFYLFSAMCLFFNKTSVGDDK